MSHFTKNSIYLLIIGCLFFACKQDGDLLRTGNIKISELKSHQNYQSPLVLENDYTGKIQLNGAAPIFTEGLCNLDDAGFYELVLNETDTLLFVLLDKERGEAEWGLKKWIPEKLELQTNFKDKLTILHPNMYVKGTATPFIFQIENWSANCQINLACTSSIGNEFLIKKGIGSTSAIIDEHSKITFTISQIEYAAIPSKYTGEIKMLSEDISQPTLLGANSVTRLTKSITLTQSGSLTINEGAVLMLDNGVNITNYGAIHFNGTNDFPILVTCTNGNEYFGGFISEGSSATIEASHTFYTHFGQHSEAEYQYGHAKHQALFKSANTKLTFNTCYFMDTPGQVFYPVNCDLTIENCILQRAKTSGQINSTKLTISNSYLSDFPNDGQVYQDEDNDAIYLSASDALITNSVFMYTKDDGIDTGGSEGGTIEIESCWFEACFHEGIAMSSANSANKTHTIKNCTFTNCQQGAELGYSSVNHTAQIINCTFEQNYIGVRFGDNYENNVDGILRVSQSSFKNNHLDTWNMVHQLWAPKISNFIIE